MRLTCYYYTMWRGDGAFLYDIYYFKSKGRDEKRLQFRIVLGEIPEYFHGDSCVYNIYIYIYVVLLYGEDPIALCQNNTVLLEHSQQTPLSKYIYIYIYSLNPPPLRVFLPLQEALLNLRSRFVPQEMSFQPTLKAFASAVLLYINTLVYLYYYYYNTRVYYTALYTLVYTTQDRFILTLSFSFCSASYCYTHIII